MAKWVTTLVAVFVLAALTGCSADEPTDNGQSASETRPAEGFFLRGGVELVYQIHPSEDGKPLDADLVRRVIEVLKRRIASGGLKNVEFSSMGRDRILIRMSADKGGSVETDDLKRLIVRANRLEFRIAPVQEGRTADGLSLSEEQYDRYVKSLREEGPDAGRKRYDKLQWFPVRGPRGDYSATGAIGQHAGQTYMLLSTQPGSTMLQSPGQSNWRIKRLYPTTGSRGRPAIGFKFDARGAKQFASLTGSHPKHFLAILIGDTVYSSPTIFETINNGEAVITGDFSRKEVTDLVRLLEAGSLPARLYPEPVSESRFGPALGEDRRCLEFSAGTKAQIVLKDGEFIEDGRFPDDSLIRSRFVSAAKELGLDKISDAVWIDRISDPDRADTFVKAYDKDGDEKVSAAELPKTPYFAKLVSLLDEDNNAVLDAEELAGLPPLRYQVTTTEVRIAKVSEAVEKAFGGTLKRWLGCKYQVITDDMVVGVGIPAAAEDGLTQIRANREGAVEVLDNYKGGLMIAVRNLSPALPINEIEDRIRRMCFQDDLAARRHNLRTIIPLSTGADGKCSSFAMLVRHSSDEALGEARWRSFAKSEMELLDAALTRSESIDARSFDPAIRH